MNRVILVVTLLYIQIKALKSEAQEYEVQEIHCSRDRSSQKDSFEAVLRKPDNFQGDPFFPDNRDIRPESDPDCSIKRIPSDKTGLTYQLKMSNLNKCKVKLKQDYLTIRIWFPRLKGVILANDQDVVILCKPANPTMRRTKSSGFAGNVPQTGRVSGVVEKNPGSLEYTLALYKESTPRSGKFDVPLAGSISIGTRLLLSASIDTTSAWKYTKLMEVSVSNDPKNPLAPGSIKLVENGCRNQNYGTIVPNQPVRPQNKSGEVNLQFEAFMLENMAPTDRLWIHSEVKACTEAVDCIAQFCMDLFQPSGHGRRKRQTYGIAQYPWSRAMPRGTSSKGFGHAELTKHEPGPIRLLNSSPSIPKDNKLVDDSEASFDENIGISIVLPSKDESEFVELVEADPCWVFVIASCTSGAFLSIAIIVIICLSCRMSTKNEEKVKATTAMNDALSSHRSSNHIQRDDNFFINLGSFSLAKRIGPSTSSASDTQLYKEEPGKLAGTSPRVV